MRISLLAFVALPVLVCGIAITTAVADVGTAEAPTPTLGKSVGDRPTRADAAGTIAQPGDDTRPGASPESGDETGDETEINGTRPHLTVSDSRAAVSPPGAIPAALAILPATLAILPPPSISLPPLSDLGGDLAWPTGGGKPRGQASPGAGEFNDPGATDVRWTDPSSAEPDSLPPGKPGGGSTLSVVPEVPSQPDGDSASEPGSGSRPPPVAGRPGRPPSDMISLPPPSDTVGLPGQDTGRPPPMAEPDPLPPGADLLAPDEVDPDADLLATAEVAPEETAVPDSELADVDGGQRDEASDATAEADVDESQPSIV